MALTIEQALQQGISAHNSGNLQEAERAYQAILRSQPRHPNANHNLGLIAVSVNQIKAALPLFETALEVNPTIEQFWVSYIDALIKDNQFKGAKQAIKKAKKNGFNTKKLEALLSQSKVTADTKGPSQAQLNSLLTCFQNGRLSDTEKLATFISQKYPNHPFSWKVLGAVLKQTDRTTESLTAMQTSVQLAPQDAEAHNNLGTTLNEIGRLDEAEASYKQAIALKPDFSEAHSNLGVTLQRQGRLDEAEASYTQAIALKPDYAEAHNNLGGTLKELGRLEEAEASHRQAIKLKPDFFECHSNLGNTLKELGRLEEAEASYRQATVLNPDYSTAKHMLAALNGETTATAPRDYVEGLFDTYATKFDSSLVDALEYGMPKAIAELIISDTEFDVLGSIADLGCGTGLFGMEIKKSCGYLEGIDLSKNMLNKAEEKNVYDKLIRQDIVQYLSNESLHFDYFISTDVFIYIGDLCDVFRLIKSRNQKSGKLAFSTEDYDEDGFFLEQSGRYSHSKKYIESLCEKFDYKIRHFETRNLRKEKNQYIRGGLYLLEF